MSVGVPAAAGLVRPPTLERALDTLAELSAADPEVLLLAGGTDVMVWIPTGGVEPRTVLDLWPLRREIGAIESAEGGIRVGALATYSEIRRHPLVQRSLPLLAAMAREVGAVQIQNRGTLGGNVGGASPAADGLTALLALDARVELASVRGRRVTSLAGFNPAYRKVERAPDELITGFLLPEPLEGTEQHWRKVGTRRAQSIGKVMLAATRRLDEGGKIDRIALSLGSVAPTVVRATAAEAAATGGDPGDPALVAAVRSALEGDIAPIDDVRSTARYRSWVAGNLVAQVVSGRGGARS